MPKPEIAKLARWPRDAFEAWPKLREADRAAVLAEMVRLYGEAFRESFEINLRRGHKRRAFAGHKTVSDDFLLQMGFRLALDSVLNRWWVHPDGTVIQEIKEASPPAPPLPVLEELPDTSDDDLVAEQNRLRDLVAADEAAILELGDKILDLNRRLRALADNQSVEILVQTLLTLHEGMEFIHMGIHRKLDPSALIGPFVEHGIEDGLKVLVEHSDRLVLAPEYETIEELRADLLRTKEELEQAVELLKIDREDLEQSFQPVE